MATIPSQQGKGDSTSPQLPKWFFHVFCIGLGIGLIFIITGYSILYRQPLIAIGSGIFFVFLGSGLALYLYRHKVLALLRFSTKETDGNEHNCCYCNETTNDNKSEIHRGDTNSASGFGGKHGDNKSSNNYKQDTKHKDIPNKTLHNTPPRGES